MTIHLRKEVEKIKNGLSIMKDAVFKPKETKPEEQLIKVEEYGRIRYNEGYSQGQENTVMRILQAIGINIVPNALTNQAPKPDTCTKCNHSKEAHIVNGEVTDQCYYQDCKCDGYEK